MLRQLNNEAFAHMYQGKSNVNVKHDVVDYAFLPCAAKEIESRLCISFMEDRHEGFDILFAVLEYDDEDCFLLFSRYITGEKKPEISIQCSTLTASDKKVDIIECVLKALKLCPLQLTWVSDGIEFNRWELLRQDDNNNEFLVRTFDCQIKALEVQEQYQSKGHKQLYWVRKEVKGS